MSSFSVFHWLIVMIVVAVIWAVFASRGRIVPSICPACGTQGWPKSKTKGSIGLEIVLWLLLIIPGLIYSVWRLTSKYQACPACEQPGMIPLDSPNGKQLAQQLRGRTPPK